MKNVLLILMREYRIRLRRPSFWVLTLAVPLLLALLYALPVWTELHNNHRSQIWVVDETGLFDGGLSSTKEVNFKPMPSLEYARRQMDDDEKADAILYIPLRETSLPRDAYLLYYGNTPSLVTQSVVDNQLQLLLRNAVLEDVYDFNPSIYHSVESLHIKLRTQEAATGKESFLQVRTIAAMALAVLMVVALLLFGVQVVRGVQEEKQNRMAEVMISTVKPEELLTGKLVGVALTALTQLVFWILLTACAISCIQASSPELFAQAREQQTAHQLATKGVGAIEQYNTSIQLVDETVQGLTALNLPLVAGMFLLLFFIGYMLYGALLAALAARLDSDSDALQWTLLLGSPLLLVLFFTPVLLQDPNGPLAQWLSCVPFTAPATLMLRLPFGISVGQVLLSIALSVACFVLAAWWAARSYRRHLI